VVSGPQRWSLGSRSLVSHPVVGGTGGIAALTEAIRSAGEQPKDRFRRRLAIPSQSWGQVLKSSLVNTVAIIGGTDDYRCASGQVITPTTSS
jgi:hypothetical protein